MVLLVQFSNHLSEVGAAVILEAQANLQGTVFLQSGVDFADVLVDLRIRRTRSSELKDVRGKPTATRTVPPLIVFCYLSARDSCGNGLGHTFHRTCFLDYFRARLLHLSPPVDLQGHRTMSRYWDFVAVESVLRDN